MKKTYVPQGKRHITHVTAYYPPHVGGMENSAHAIAGGLAEKGYNISVLTSNIGVTHPLKNQHNLTISYLKSIELAHTPIMFTLLFSLLKSPKNSLFHIHIAHAYTPEVVFLVSRLRHIPYVAHIHLDVDPSGIFGFLLGPYKTFFLRQVLHHASSVICLSDEQKNSIQKKYQLPSRKIAVVPNGVSEDFFMKRIIKAQKLPHILFVGRLASQKRVQLLVKAVSLLKQPVIVDIVGDGEDREEIKKMVSELHLKNITLHGIKQGKALRFLYARASVFVLPSEKEGVSLSLLEAMASGLPIVAFDVPGVHDLIIDCGLLIKSQTPKALAQKLDMVISNTALQQEISRKVQKKARQFAWSTVVEKIEKIYKEVTYDY